MSETKWTPGPWTYKWELDKRQRGWVRGSKRLGDNPKNIAVARVCNVSGMMSERKEAEANAQLIAAAPELYEALVAAQAHLEYCGYGDKWEREGARESKLKERIESAIKKARGE